MQYRKRDLERMSADDQIDNLMQTQTGRDAYWSELESQCLSSSLIFLLESTLHLDGNIIECGVFRGRSVKMIGRKVKQLAPDKTIYACDSYEGFPEGNINHKDTTLFRPVSKLEKKCKATGDVPDRLHRFFETYSVHGEVVKGYFENTLPPLNSGGLCFIHIDCDTYQSHIDCLNSLYDRLVPGGIVVFDDYHEKNWPGATTAVDEVFSNKLEKPKLCKERKHKAWFVQKPTH